MISTDIISKDKNNNVKLSIAIPTHNGAKYIREALDSIICQLNDIDEEIEIVISDNASTDQTPEIIKEYQRKYTFIKYFLNEENLGADRNFDLAVRRSIGEYVWLFSDDDKMTPESIKKVLKVIDSHKDLAVIVVNYRIYDEILGKIIKERVVSEYNDILFESSDDFWSKLDVLSALISVNIVRRSLWGRSNVECFYSTNWVHVGVIISILPGHKSFFISTPLIILNSGPTEWEKDGNGLKYAMMLWDLFTTIDELGYHKLTRDKILKSFFNRLPATIKDAKSNGLVLSLKIIQDMYSRYANHPSFWLVDLPLLLLPNQIYNSKVVRFVYKIAKKKYKRLRSKILLLFSIFLHDK
jgi:abequosyltransferase